MHSAHPGLATNVLRLWLGKLLGRGGGWTGGGSSWPLRWPVMCGPEAMKTIPPNVPILTDREEAHGALWGRAAERNSAI